MSRCVTLYRPPPTVDDLSVTAEGMVQSVPGLKRQVMAMGQPPVNISIQPLK